MDLLLLKPTISLRYSFGNVPRDCPKDYDVEASNDNFASEVKVLKTVRGAPDCAPDVIVTVAFDNKVAYKSYRCVKLSMG